MTDHRSMPRLQLVTQSYASCLHGLLADHEKKIGVDDEYRSIQKVIAAMDAHVWPVVTEATNANVHPFPVIRDAKDGVG